MTGVMCAKHSSVEAYSYIAFLKKFLCLTCVKALGDFDQRGRLDDKRIKRDGPKK